MKKFGLLLTVLLFSSNLSYTQSPQTLPFSQDWNDTTLIKVSDDWTGVLGIIGFRGDNLAATTGVDPQTILDGDDPGVIDVIANLPNPGTNTSGGVGEFEITDPVIALQGSGTADAPYLRISITTIGNGNIQISYNVRDIDTTDNAIQQVALQYRIGNSGDFTNVPAGFIADATTGPSLATLVTPISVTLPSEVNNQSEVQIRIITANAVGSDEWVGIDDISITGVSIGPALTVNPTSLSVFTYVLGSGPSESKSYLLGGSNLDPADGNIIVTGSTNYEVSTDNSNFSSSVNVAYTGGALSDTTIYVRLIAGLSVGTYDGEIISNAGGGATTQGVTVNGSVTLSAVISVTPITLTGFSYVFGNGPSASQSYTLNATDLSPVSGDITVAGSSNYEISFDDTNFTDTLIVSYTGGLLSDTTIYVRLKTDLSVGNYNNELIENSGGGAVTENVTVSGSVTAPPLPIVENFDYATGQLTSANNGDNVSANNWISFSGGGFFFPVISGNLTYNNYSASNVGNKIQMVAAPSSAEDARRDIIPQSGDGTKVYASFLINVQSAPASGGSSYFASLYSTAAGFKGRIYVQTLGSGIEFGLEGSGSTPVFTNAELPLNQTHLIVVCYKFLAGADSVKLWVNPVLSATEPTPNLTFIVATDFAVCDAFALRQASSSGVAQNPDAEIDGIIIGSSWSDISSGTVDVSSNPVTINEFDLAQNYPNPFNPTTTIRFSLPEAGNVKLTVFNILGQEIQTLINGFKGVGTHTVKFEATNLNSGIYIYKIEAGTFVQTRKMLLLK